MASKLILIIVLVIDVIAFALAVAAEQRRSTVSFSLSLAIVVFFSAFLVFTANFVDLEYFTFWVCLVSAILLLGRSGFAEIRIRKKN